MELAPNGLRYPLVGGTRERHFDGTSFKPRKRPENAQTPTSRVHAVLGAFLQRFSPPDWEYAYCIPLDNKYSSGTLSFNTG
jgi:hypothetical protein